VFCRTSLEIALTQSRVDNQQEWAYLAVDNQQELAKTIMPEHKADVLQGTLDLMVLKTLHALGPLHGYGIARRIEQVSENLLQLNQGTLYPALLRLQQKKWITARWGVSENNRKAKFYSITATGEKQLAREAENWERIAAVMSRLLAGPQEV
jgi:PadR family transcriptional regulator, regulatory protein PadR